MLPVPDEVVEALLDWVDGEMPGAPTREDLARDLLACREALRRVLVIATEKPWTHEDEREQAYDTARACLPEHQA